MVTTIVAILALVIGYVVGYVVGQANGWNAARTSFAPAKTVVKVPVTATTSPALALAKAKPAKRGRPVGKKKVSAKKRR